MSGHHRPIVQLQLFEDRAHLSAAMNMALDEALLEDVAVPLLRFYSWSRQSVSFGYFGAFNDVAYLEQSHELVRRWTGGGIVMHEDDLTYSLIIPAAHELHCARATAIYSVVHEAIQRALAAAGTAATLALATDQKVSEACFANPARDDVMLDGRKIAGAAIRRTRSGVLQQGSIRGIALPPDFTHSFAGQLAETIEPFTLPAEILNRATVLAREKYGTSQWLRRR